MQWTRYLLLTLMILQALTEAKRRKANRTRQDKRNQLERARAEETGTSEIQLPQDGGTEAPRHSGEHRHRLHHCPSCYQLRKKLRLAQIKDRVLTATGLLTPPNMTGVVISKNPNIQGIIDEMNASAPHPAYMQEPPYNNDEPEIKTELMFSPVEPAPAGLNIPPNMDVLYFKLNHEQLGNRVKRAILHVWLKPMHSELDRTVPISVYKVSRPDLPGGYIKINEVTTVSESFDAREGNWVKIEVYKLLQEWLNKPDENLGLVVTAYDSEGRQVAVTDPSEMPSNAPMLEIHTEEGRRSRTRRNIGSYVCTNNNMESRCCRYPLVVNFVELGWDFIVAPKVYEANFCNGECPFLYAHKYAHTSLIQKLNSTNAKHGPCCGARKLSPMKMLYYDHDHKIKFDTIQDMVVDRCGCS
ncbi:growth/differentiation factor 8 isoform X2 [Panulirus ornatus]|uniref:growth/differentiation factor 8 isoform X2 n=1 Tax=Panulirus ornatus TaxID=150431 RepID=UPI003A88706F